MALSLGWRLVRQLVFALLGYGLILFLTAGTLRYWEGWAFLAILFVPGVFFCFYYLKRDPELVRRRLETKERVAAQKWIIKIAQSIFALAFLIPGLDFRFRWTKTRFGGVPLWLEILSLSLVLASYLFVIWVMDVNRYAARTVRVEEGQKVISTGPYKWLRHPFYAGAVILFLATPLGLGSCVALPVFALVIPVFVIRLLNEEQVLRRELLGYTEYCQGTPYRLVPYVW
jgi:protein-S-isoprenylcysteine O-methyltransferase Ste14